VRSVGEDIETSPSVAFGGTCALREERKLSFLVKSFVKESEGDLDRLIVVGGLTGFW